MLPSDRWNSVLEANSEVLFHHQSPNKDKLPRPPRAQWSSWISFVSTKRKNPFQISDRLSFLSTWPGTPIQASVTYFNLWGFPYLLFLPISNMGLRSTVLSVSADCTGVCETTFELTLKLVKRVGLTIILRLPMMLDNCQENASRLLPGVAARQGPLWYFASMHQSRWNWYTRADCPITYFRPANLVLQPRDSQKLNVYCAITGHRDAAHRSLLVFHATASHRAVSGLCQEFAGTAARPLPPPDSRQSCSFTWEKLALASVFPLTGTLAVSYLNTPHSSSQVLGGCLHPVSDQSLDLELPLT